MPKEKPALEDGLYHLIRDSVMFPMMRVIRMNFIKWYKLGVLTAYTGITIGLIATVALIAIKILESM